MGGGTQSRNPIYLTENGLMKPSTICHESMSIRKKKKKADISFVNYKYAAIIFKTIFKSQR